MSLETFAAIVSLAKLVALIIFCGWLFRQLYLIKKGRW